MMVWVALLQPFDAMSMTAIGSLRGAGDTMFAFWVMGHRGLGHFSARHVGHSPFPWGGGPTTAWIGAVVYVAFLAAVTVRRWHGGAWETRRI